MNDQGPDPDWTARARRRVKAVLEVLAEQSGPMLKEDAWAAAVERVPLQAWDLTSPNDQDVRYRYDMKWSLSTNHQHAGYVHVADGSYRLTTLGRAKLDEKPSADDLHQAALAGYIAWDKARKEKLSASTGDPASEVVHPGSGAAHALRAVRPVLDAWRTGGSCLQSQTPAWTSESTAALLDHLETHATDYPDLPGLNDPPRLLASEASILLWAPFTTIRSSDKRWGVRQPLMFMQTVPPLPITLSADLESGFVPPWSRRLADYVAALLPFLRLLRGWWRLPGEDQARAWANPWFFRDTLLSIGPAEDQLVSLLCLLAHPSSFTPLLLSEDRRAVSKSFSDRLESEPVGDLERDLRLTVLALQVEAGGQGVDLLAPPLVGQWSGTSLETAGAYLVRGQVDQQNRVRNWVKHGNVTLTTGMFRALPEHPDQPALAGMVDEAYSDYPVSKREAKKHDVVTFVLGMRPGDMICTDDNGNLRHGYLEDGPPRLESVGGKNLTVRPVRWVEDHHPITDLPSGVRTRLRFKGEDVLDITDLLEPLEALFDPEPADESDEPLSSLDSDIEMEPEAPAPPTRAELACDTVALAAELGHLDDSWLRELLISLNERRQVVLEGPPGTGKTYVAQLLIEACGLTPNQQALVQFHPTYSYEDFVEGFRPAEADSGPRLTVVPGPLKRLAEEAREAPGRPHILVIDEINRANLAKVFGELYFLLEYRNSEIELLYGGGQERFTLPDNLFILGTMNTADRSIALLDAAMRRRFVFLGMGDDEPALAEVLPKWCERNGIPAGVARLRRRINDQMLARGLDPALAFGPSYFMRPPLAGAEALQRLWRRELLPMLREHHYADDSALATYHFEAWCAELGLGAGDGQQG